MKATVKMTVSDPNPEPVGEPDEVTEFDEENVAGDEVIEADGSDDPGEGGNTGTEEGEEDES